MERICVPFIGTTENMHIGTLYTGILIDAYRKAALIKGKEFVAREAWNCYSQRLEEKISEVTPQTHVRAKCREEFEKALANCKANFNKYRISLDSPILLDSSDEYSDFVRDYYERACKLGRVINGKLQIRSFEDTLSQFRKTSWFPNIPDKRMNGAQSLKELTEIEVFRKGIWGIQMKPSDSFVFGQRFVQALMPQFYASREKNDLVFIGGNDVLTKLIYQAYALSQDSSPFARVALTGLVLDKNGKKVSRYALNEYSQDIRNLSPDSVRLGLISQPLNRDFKMPDFSVYEKVRKKAVNCLNFIENFAQVRETGLALKETSDRITGPQNSVLQDISNFNFCRSYEGFRNIVFEEMSKYLIPRIQDRGITPEGKNFMISQLKSLGSIFLPLSISSD